MGSQGCLFTASATRQVPRSITPTAASITLYLVVVVDRLRLHPGDEYLAGLESGLFLHSVDQVLVVEVAVAEVEADQRVAQELGLTHGALVHVGPSVLEQQRVQTRDPGQCIECQAERLLDGDLGDRLGS